MLIQVTGWYAKRWEEKKSVVVSALITAVCNNNYHVATTLAALESFLRDKYI